MDVSRETNGEPLLFWRVCAADATMAPEHKIRWLTASYQHVVMLSGLSMPAGLVEQRIGVAAVMARLTDMLLETAGKDAEIDAFIVQWLCFACDQLWAWVPVEARNGAGEIEPDAPLYSAWLAEMERRLPGLGALPDQGREGDGDRMVLVCPGCQWLHAIDITICRNCAAPLAHVEPVPYSTARRRKG
jgi:hypothetical protein